MRKSPWLWLTVVIFLVALGIGTVTGLFTFINPVTQFLSFVFLLVVIALLAVVGAIFLGMLITHRALSSEAFTPFEEEMLRMKRDVEEMKKDLEEMKELLKK